MDHRVYKHDKGFYVVDTANRLHSGAGFVVDGSTGVYTDGVLEVGTPLLKKPVEFVNYPSLPKCDHSALPVLERVVDIPSTVYLSVSARFTCDLQEHYQKLVELRGNRDAYASFSDFDARLTEIQSERPKLEAYLEEVLGL